MFRGLRRVWASLYGSGTTWIALSSGAAFYQIIRALANLTSNNVAAEYQSLTARSYFSHQAEQLKENETKQYGGEEEEDENMQLVGHMVDNFVYVMQLQYAACYAKLQKGEDLAVIVTGWEPLTKKQIERLKGGAP